MFLAEVNEEYLILADRYKFDTLLRMCVEEYVHCPNQDVTKTIVNSDTVSEGVKLLILERKLARLNNALEKERKYKHTVENQLDSVSPRKRWTNRFGLYHTKNEKPFKWNINHRSKRLIGLFLIHVCDCNTLSNTYVQQHHVECLLWTYDRIVLKNTCVVCITISLAVSKFYNIFLKKIMFSVSIAGRAAILWHDHRCFTRSYI